MDSAKRYKIVEHILESIKDGAPTSYIAFLCGDKSKARIMEFKPKNRAQKLELLRRAKRIARVNLAHTVYSVFEAWAVSTEDGDRSKLPDDLGDCDNKKEMLIVDVQTHTSRNLLQFEIVRDKSNRIVELKPLDGGRVFDVGEHLNIIYNKKSTVH